MEEHRVSGSQTIRTIKTDVLVAGSGGAGFRAAIGAREKGAEVFLVSKGRLAHSGASPMAGADLTCHGQGMRAAGFFGEPRDSEEKFFSDIVHQGSFHNNQKLTELYVKDGPQRMLEMLRWGMKPNFTDERAVFTPGPSIVDALHRQARSLGVKMVEDVALLDLYVKDGRVNGALGLDLKCGEFIRFEAKAVILATGGWHKAFSVVTGSRELTGDGVAMAYRAGADLTDMEFITFACNTIYWPLAYRGSIFTYVLGLVAGGVLENRAGDRLFDQYDPWMIHYANHTEWNKSFISLISALEVRSGGGLAHGGLRFTPGDVPFPDFEKLVLPYYPNWTFHDGSFKAIGDQLRRGEGVEVGPGAEYFEGGIAVNERYESSLPGLYAAGECAASVFGANRVAAATMEMLTTGARAGWAAGEYAHSVGACEVDAVQEREQIAASRAFLARGEGLKPSEVRIELQEQSQQKMGPVRNAEELTAYLDYMADLKQNKLPVLAVASDNPVYNKAWIEALDLVNMATVMEASARSALERSESRGVHYREDFPQVDNDQWRQQIIVSQKDSSMQLSKRAVDSSLLKAPVGVTPYMEFVRRMMQAHSEIGGHH